MVGSLIMAAVTLEPNNYARGAGQIRSVSLVSSSVVKQSELRYGRRAEGGAPVVGVIDSGAGDGLDGRCIGSVIQSGARHKPQFHKCCLTCQGRLYTLKTKTIRFNDEGI